MADKPKIALVTGGAGFVGSHLVHALAASGWRVRVLDDFSTGRPENLADFTGVEIVRGDVSRFDEIVPAIADVEVVFHLAAVASVQASVERPLDCHRVNLTGTLHVLEAARQSGVRRFVFAASSSAYGNSSAEVQRESDPVEPLSPYAAAKLGSECYARAFAASFPLEAVCLRFFNIYGPRQRDDSPYSGVIALFARALMAGRTPTIFGDGRQSRDFVYVTDAVAALIAAAETPGVSGNVYNIGTGTRVSVVELLAALNRTLGTNVKAAYGLERAGDVRHSCADISRARRDLGYEPRVALDEGLALLNAQWRSKNGE